MSKIIGTSSPCQEKGGANNKIKHFKQSQELISTKRIMNKKIALILLLSFIMACSIKAQRKKNAAKKAEPTVVAPSEEEINYANLLPATAKIIFIDSLVVDNDDILNHICISPDCGSMELELKDSNVNYKYVNEMQTICYHSIADSIGNHQLFVQNKIGHTWTEPKQVILEGNFQDIICPYLMPDGVTLYFAARKGHDNIGKHDIFYTVYDTDNRTFYRPQSIGLPYNSMSEDLYCIIDDISNIGHLVTQRHQPEGKSCIYTFIPTESRNVYDSENTSVEQLASFAALNSIKDTQYDDEQLKSAKSRLQSLRDNASSESQDKIHFIVNEKITYNSLSDFKTNTNRELYEQFTNRNAELKQNMNALSIMRGDYHKGDKSKRTQILEMEEYLQKERIALSKMEKQIRNAELMHK